jgi:hypothetical protein
MQGATDYYGDKSKADLPASYALWVKDGTWAEAGAVNAVKFVLDLPLSQSRLSVVVENAQTFLDLWGQVGGVLALLLGFFLAAMSYFERSYDKRDPLSRVAAWAARLATAQTDRLRARWYPEPEAWTMISIAKGAAKEIPGSANPEVAQVGKAARLAARAEKQAAREPTPRATEEAKDGKSGGVSGYSLSPATAKPAAKGRAKGRAVVSDDVFGDEVFEHHGEL